MVLFSLRQQATVRPHRK